MWKAAWILAIGCNGVHVDPLLQLQPYQAVNAIRGLSVPDMSEPGLVPDCSKHSFSIRDSLGFNYLVQHFVNHLYSPDISYLLLILLPHVLNLKVSCDVSNKFRAVSDKFRAVSDGFRAVSDGFRAGWVAFVRRH